MLNTLHVHGFGDVMENAVQEAFASPMSRFHTLQKLNVCRNVALFKDGLEVLGARTGALRRPILEIPCCNTTVIEGLLSLIAGNPFLAQIKLCILGLEFEQLEASADGKMYSYGPDVYSDTDFEVGDIGKDVAWLTSGNNPDEQSHQRHSSIQSNEKGTLSIRDSTHIINYANS